MILIVGENNPIIGLFQELEKKELKEKSDNKLKYLKSYLKKLVL